MKADKISTEPYKGVRDFFPEDMAALNKIFDIWRDIVTRYGYEEYNASVLEPSELYRSKSSEEIINDQTYSFIDRGDRQVTLRPEMTPTVARMVAAKKRDLVFPLRWFSIPNLFRYEQPQRGRLREHWQLNVDIFGVESILAEVEVINIAFEIMLAYGLKENNFEIRINSRQLINYMVKELYCFNDELARKLSRLIDKKDKISPESFKSTISEIFAENAELSDAVKSQKIDEFMTLLNSPSIEAFASNLPEQKSIAGMEQVKMVIKNLQALNINNARFDPTLMRGFDYYTGIVFEIYDLNPNNRRSVFGGGRYEELLSLFGNDKVTAVGFGAGDVIARDLMETYGTLQPYMSKIDLAICVMGEKNASHAEKLAQSLRNKTVNRKDGTVSGLRVFVDFSNRKLSDQISGISKRKIPFLICIGDNEVQSGKYTLKEMGTGLESEVSESNIIDKIIV